MHNCIRAPVTGAHALLLLCTYTPAYLYRTWEPACSYKNPHKWKGTLGMVCEKRTYLKRLFCKADSRNIVLEAGGQEQGIRQEDKERNSEKQNNI